MTTVPLFYKTSPELSLHDLFQIIPNNLNQIILFIKCVTSNQIILLSNCDFLKEASNIPNSV